MFKFLCALFILCILSLNVVAANFTRLTGVDIQKPFNVSARKGIVYLEVMGKKVRISQKETLETLETYRAYLPDKQTLFGEAKRWYNMTRTFWESR